MPKIPDFSELAKNLNLQGIVDSLKSAVGTATGSSGITNPPTGDELAAKFAELHELLQNLATIHSQQGKAMAQVTAKVEALYKDMQALRQATPTTVTEVASAPADVGAQPSADQTATSEATQESKEKI